MRQRFLLSRLPSFLPSGIGTSINISPTVRGDKSTVVVTGEPSSCAEPRTREFVHRNWKIRRRQTNSFTALSTLYLTVFTVSLIAICPCMAECPESCDCKWKSGKETVECRNVGLIEVPADLDSGTQVLDMSLNNLQMLPMGTFSNAGLVHLQRLYLVGCNLAQIDKEAFRNLANLVELDISENGLSYVPTTVFREIPMLRKLFLSHNPIWKLHEYAFEGLRSLSTLELSGCQIEFIDAKAFKDLNDLAVLKLDNNRLSTVRQKTIAHLSNLQLLYFTNNPWQCDCQLRDIFQWIETRNVPIGVYPKCGGPSRLSGREWSTLEVDDFVCEPHVVVYPTEIELSAEENVTLSCKVTADPEPAVRWLWKGKAVANASWMGTSFLAGESYGSEASWIGGQLKVFITEEGTFDKVSNLTLIGADSKDSGVYACVAANYANRASANVSVTVHQDAVEGEGLTSVEVYGIAVGAIVAVALLIVTGCLLLVKCDRCTSWGKRKQRIEEDFAAAAPSINFLSFRGMPEGSSSAAITTILEERDMKLLGPNPIQKPPRLGSYRSVPTVDLDLYDKMNSIVISSYSVGANGYESSPRECTDTPTLWELPQSMRLHVSNILEADEDDDVGLGRGVRDKLLPLPEAGDDKESEEDSGLESERGREEADLSLELDRIVLGKGVSALHPSTSTSKIPGRSTFVECAPLTATTASTLLRMKREPAIAALSASAKVISEIITQTPQFSLHSKAPVIPMKAIVLESPLPWIKVPAVATFATFPEEAQDGTEV